MAASGTGIPVAQEPQRPKLGRIFGMKSSIEMSYAMLGFKPRFGTWDIVWN
jgi:hypothetical protein